MTLQVGLVASNGFVIASDRKASRDFKAIPQGRVRGASSQVRKILVTPNKKLVCAFSGDDLSKNVADALVAWCPAAFASDADVENYFKATSQPFIFKNSQPENQQIIVGVAAPNVSPLWRLFYYSGSAITQPIKDKIIGGDETNPANYILERFYRAGSSVDELTMLAVHFVLEGKDFSAQM